jgi:rare lipoprotein A
MIFVLGGCGQKVINYSSQGYSYQKDEGYDDDQIRSSYDRSNIRSGANIHRATMRPYEINGKRYFPTMVEVGDSFDGIASWYGPDFHGKKTSNGETYNMYDLTAAHKTLPMNTVVKVTNLKNKRSVVVRINDRGPFVKTRIIDLSYATAKRLDVVKHGTAPVILEIVGFDGKIAMPDAIKKHESRESSSYLLQIGAFRNQSGARKFQQQNDHDGHSYKAIIKEGVLSAKPIYRVYLSGFRSEDEANDFKQSRGFENGMVIGE